MHHYLGHATDELTRLKALMTAKEICQQPNAWRKTSASIVACQEALLAFMAPLLAKRDLRIIMTGAGTSAFIGDALAPTLNQISGKRIDSVATTDLVSNPYQYLSEDVPTLLVSFGRSGNSPESLAAVALANQCLSECYHLVLTCNAAGQLYQQSIDNPRAFALLMPEETHDKSFAMTSSFSSMMLSALLILSADYNSTQRAERICRSSEDLIPEFNSKISKIAVQKFDRVIYLGSGGLQGLAQESALKLLELTAGQVVASYDSPLGFRHGPKSIVNSSTLIIVYISNHPYTRKFDLDLLQELRRDNVAAKIIAITAQQDDIVAEGDFWLVDDMATATDAELLFPYALFAQMYAFHRSLALSKTPDNPCPTGEVNRVVQGVTLHEFNK